MNIVQDGGSAFPSPTGNPNQNGGLTIRDWFAGQYTNTHENIGPKQVAEILGIDVPDLKANNKVWFQFWMNWEAYRKYPYADAMLKQREA